MMMMMMMMITIRRRDSATYQKVISRVIATRGSNVSKKLWEELIAAFL
jgi:hypothetical protein